MEAMEGETSEALNASLAHGFYMNRFNVAH